tara:strand:- start:38 stop:298 length:261 start_codon:yes stop_codon:yes gene_type:complete
MSLELENGIKLESVGCVLDSNAGIVYPMLADGTTDLEDDGTHLEDVTEEWVDGLSSEDAATVLTTSHNLRLLGPYADDHLYTTVYK